MTANTDRPQKRRRSARPPRGKSTTTTPRRFTQLREALIAADNILASIPRLQKAADLCGCPVSITDVALRSFRDPPEDRRHATMLPEHAEQLEAFLYRTPLGLTLRDPMLVAAPGLRHVFHALLHLEPPAAGRDVRPAAASDSGRHLDSFAGTFFVYHGSYIRPEHFAVRLATIARARNGSMSVEDRIADNVTYKLPARGDATRSHAAHGCLSLVNGHPHILLFANDNAVGWRLIIIDDPDARSERIDEMKGHMFGVTEANQHFVRAISFHRADEEASAAELIRQTGVYRIDNPKLVDTHRQAICKLAENSRTQVFADPLLGLGPEILHCR